MKEKHIAVQTSYPFVDWIRMIAMAGIVWAHTPNFKGQANFHTLDHILLYFLFMDFFKFGVICFFMISGFLLAKKLPAENASAYFRKRLSSTFLPYLFAFACIVLLFIFKTQVLHLPSSLTVTGYCINMFFESALWFLPNYWVSLLVILSFRKWLNNPYFGFFLGTVTLISTFYFVYSPYAQSHVHAFFAFIFYLWLGFFIGRQNWHEYFQKLDPVLLILICAVLYILTALESYLLYQAGSNEPMNILRLSNQVYSVCIFITIVRIFKKPLISNLVNPRKETFGIYLYHMFPLAMVPFILKVFDKFGIHTFSMNTYQFIGWFVMKFIIVYLITLIIVKILLRYNIGYLNR